MLCILLGCPVHTFAQESRSAGEASTGRFHHIGDTLSAYFKTPVVPKPLSWKAIAIPTALITYGTISATSGWFDDVNLLGKRWASDAEDPDHKTRIDDLTQYIPAIAVYGLNIAGVRGKNNWIDASFMYAVSNGIANAIVVPVKRISEKRRPDSSDALSFPSGHTATAFVSAEFLRQEYKDVSPWIGAGGYAVAIATGYLRMYNNKHWFSDVAAGAGIGILSTRVSYWLYPKAKNLILGRSAGGSATLIVPTYGNGQLGFCMLQRL
jgi:membrane-associated phospholipid phosphatase